MSLPRKSTASSMFSSLSLHDALPILQRVRQRARLDRKGMLDRASCERVGDSRGHTELAERLVRHLVRLLFRARSEEHTSELQSHVNLVCRLLLEKKKITLPSLMLF